MPAAVSGKPADMDGCRRGRANVKLERRMWTTAVSVRAARGEDLGTRSECSEQVSACWRSIRLMGFGSQAQTCFDVIIYSVGITGI